MFGRQYIQAALIRGVSLFQGTAYVECMLQNLKKHSNCRFGTHTQPFYPHKLHYFIMFLHIHEVWPIL